MEKHLSQNSRRDILFGVIAALVIIADQLTKWGISNFVPENTVFWDARLFQIIHVTNTGVSFGLFQGYLWMIVLVVFAEMGILVTVVVMLRKRLSFMDNILMRVALGLVMGGAIGNQIDRIFHGRVTDFIDFKVWPVFNVADMSAVIGTIIIAYCIIFRSGLIKSKHG
jgi:signal peptidase II